MGVSWHSRSGKPPGSNTKHTPPPPKRYCQCEKAQGGRITSPNGGPATVPRQSEDAPLSHGDQQAPTAGSSSGQNRASAEHTVRAAPLRPVSKQAGWTACRLRRAVGPAAPVGRAALGRAGVLCACPPYGRWAPRPQNNPACPALPAPAELWNPDPWRCLAPPPIPPLPPHTQQGGRPRPAPCPRPPPPPPPHSG